MRWRSAVVVTVVALVAGCAGDTFDEPGTLRAMTDGDGFVVPRARGGRCSFDHRSQLHLIDRSGEIVWTRDVPWIMADDAVAIAGGLVVGSSAPHPGGAPSYAFALDLSDGSPRWQRALSPAQVHLRGGPVVDGVVVVGDESDLVGLDASTGEERWRTGVGIHDSVTTDGGVVTVASTGQLTTIDPSTGDSVSMDHAVDTEQVVTLIADGDRVVVVENGRSFTSIDTSTAVVRWQRTAGLPGDQYAEVRRSGPVLLATTDYPAGAMPQVVALDRETGDELWRREARLRAPVGTTVAVLDGGEYPSPAVVDLATGERRWTIDTSELAERQGRILESFGGQPSDDLLLMSIAQLEEGSSSVGPVIAAMNPADGAIEWTIPGIGLTLEVGAEWDDNVVLGFGAPEGRSSDEEAGAMTIVRRSDGQVQGTHTLRDPVRTRPIPAGDHLVVLSSDHAIACA